MSHIRSFITKLNQMKLLRIPFVDKLIFIGLGFINLLFIFLFYGEVNAYSYHLFIILFSILSLSILLLPRIVNKVVFSLILFLIYIYQIVQEIYYSAFSQYFMLKTVRNLATTALQVKSSVLEFVELIYFVPLLFYCLTLLLLFVVHNNKKSKWTFCVCMAPLFIFLMLNANESINKKIAQSELSRAELKYYQSDFYIYHEIPNMNSFVERFGKFGILYYELDDKRSYQFNESLAFETEELFEIIVNRRTENHLIDNEYTNLFSGKDLLLIEAESLVNFAIDKNLTPTLYRLLNEGYVFTGYNSILLAGSTADTEFSVHTSMIPPVHGVTYFENAHNYYPTTLTRLFKEGGYYSTAFHANSGAFYNRNQMLYTFGYDLFIDADSISMPHYQLDSIMAQEIQNFVSDTQPNFMFWITYNGHQPYHSIGKEYACSNDFYIGIPESYYLAANSEYPNDDSSLNCYRAKIMDLDKGIGFFIDHYPYELDNLVIIVYGDHHPKGLGLEIENFDRNYENNTPFLIWNSELGHKLIDKPSTVLDVLPTIANLFGFVYDSGTVYGYDLLAPNYYGFYYNNLDNIVTKNYTYEAVSDTLIVLNSAVSEEEIRQEITDFFFLREISRTLIKIDFFGTNQVEYEDSLK